MGSGFLHGAFSARLELSPLGMGMGKTIWFLVVGNGFLLDQGGQTKKEKPLQHFADEKGTPHSPMNQPPPVFLDSGIRMILLTRLP